jgi:hypothetical protein
MKEGSTNRYKKIVHLLFWLVVTLVFLYDRRYLIQKAGLDHFAECVGMRLVLIISLTYLNLYYLIPKFFSSKRYFSYFSLLIIATLVYVTLQNLYDIYLYGYVIGDIESRGFFYAIPYNFIITSWYLLLMVALKLSLDYYEQKRTGKNAHDIVAKSTNGQEHSPEKYVFLKSGTKQIKTDLSTIIYIQGLKDYSIIVTDKDKIIVKGSLKIVAQQLLGMKKLIRVHKSYLVAAEKIDVVKEGKIIFDGHAIPIGRMYKKELEAMLFN